MIASINLQYKEYEKHQVDTYVTFLPQRRTEPFSKALYMYTQWIMSGEHTFILIMCLIRKARFGGKEVKYNKYSIRK